MTATTALLLDDQVGSCTLETSSGLLVNLLDPRAESIRLEDIAHHLAQENRYGGACARPYSVAEHVCLVTDHLAARGMPADIVFAGLHHDDAEYLLKDIPAPIKGLFEPIYSELTRRLDDAISTALGTPRRPLPADVEQAVHESDMWARTLEAENLLTSRGRHWQDNGTAVVLGHGVEARGPRLARGDHAYWAWRYLDMHETLEAEVQS